MGVSTHDQQGKPPWILIEPTDADKVLGRQIHARWDELKAVSRPAPPDQFGTPPAQAQAWVPQGPPPAQPYPQGPPQGYQPPQQFQQGPPQGWPQQ